MAASSLSVTLYPLPFILRSPAPLSLTPPVSFAGAKWLQKAGRKLGERRCPRPSAPSLPSAPPSVDSSPRREPRRQAVTGEGGRVAPPPAAPPRAPRPAGDGRQASSGRSPAGPAATGRLPPPVPPRGRVREPGQPAARGRRRAAEQRRGQEASPPARGGDKRK